MNRKGYTIIEILISVSLILILFLSLFKIMNLSFKLYKNYSYNKELLESSDLLKRVLSKELSDIEYIDSYIDTNDNIMIDIPEEGIDLKCIKFKKSRYSKFYNNYVEKIIFIKSYDIDKRRSVWLIKNSNNNKNIDISKYTSYSSYEIGIHLNNINIKKVNESLYLMSLEFKYYDKDIFVHKSIFIKLK